MDVDVVLGEVVKQKTFLSELDSKPVLGLIVGLGQLFGHPFDGEELKVVCKQKELYLDWDHPILCLDVFIGVPRIFVCGSTTIVSVGEVPELQVYLFLEFFSQ